MSGIEEVAAPFPVGLADQGRAGGRWERPPCPAIGFVAGGDQRIAAPARRVSRGQVEVDVVLDAALRVDAEERALGHALERDKLEAAQ